MGVPDSLLPHTITRVRPAQSTDAHGNTVYDYGEAAARKAMRGWVQQDRRSEPREDGRDPLEQRWLLVTNDQDIQGRDRIEWSGPTMEVEGPPEPVFTPAGYHHLESTLRVVAG
ncbi:hypothetical protein ABZ814_13495 [Micromonospora musae]|uniref:hypothetical protein n=1 Tax=Micromonospora musae TaxID=1894970 RepID=UPI0033DFC5C1